MFAQELRKALVGRVQAMLLCLPGAVVALVLDLDPVPTVLVVLLSGGLLGVAASRLRRHRRTDQDSEIGAGSGPAQADARPGRGSRAVAIGVIGLVLFGALVLRFDSLGLGVAVVLALGVMIVLGVRLARLRKQPGAGLRGDEPACKPGPVPPA